MPCSGARGPEKPKSRMGELSRHPICCACIHVSIKYSYIPRSRSLSKCLLLQVRPSHLRRPHICAPVSEVLDIPRLLAAPSPPASMRATFAHCRPTHTRRALLNSRPFTPKYMRGVGIVRAYRLPLQSFMRLGDAQLVIGATVLTSPWSPSTPLARTPERGPANNNSASRDEL